MQIKHRYTSTVLLEGECDNLRDELIAAVKAYADLADADLAGADLVGADLAYADLAGANLADANLADANLARANLARANLARANSPALNSHDFWAELLFRTAGNDLHRRMVAGLVLVSRDWCWPRMIALMTGELSEDWNEWVGAIFWRWPERCRELGLPEVAAAVTETKDVPA